MATTPWQYLCGSVKHFCFLDCFFHIFSRSKQIITSWRSLTWYEMKSASFFILYSFTITITRLLIIIHKADSLSLIRLSRQSVEILWKNLTRHKQLFQYLIRNLYISYMVYFTQNAMATWVLCAKYLTLQVSRNLDISFFLS